MAQVFPQTSYDYAQPNAFAGMAADGYKNEILSYRNSETSDVPFGIVVAQGTNEEDFKLPVPGSVFVGMLQHTHAVDQRGMTEGLATPTGVKGTATATGPGRGNVVRKGRLYATVEQTVAVSDPVYVRVTANGAGKLQLGALRKDNDSGNAVLFYGARWIKGALSGACAMVEIDVTAHLAAGDASADGTLRSDLASTATNKGASLVGVADATGLITGTTVETALVEVKGDRVNIESTFATSDSGAGKTLVASGLLPTGKKLYIDDLDILVNGATAWTDTTATKVILQDLNGTPVSFAEFAKAQLTGNAALGKYSSGVSLKTGFWSGGTANMGLAMKGDASFAAGSTMTVRIKAHLG